MRWSEWVKLNGYHRGMNLNDCTGSLYRPTLYTSKTGYQNLQWVRMRFKFSTLNQALKQSTQPNYGVSIPFWNSCISMTGANRCKLGISKNRLHGNISCCPTSVDCQWYSCPHGGSTCQYMPTKQKYLHLPQQNNAVWSRKWSNNCIRHLKTCISCWPNLNVNFVLGEQSGPAKVTTAIT